MYYSFRNILGKKADVNIVVGQRGNGKSYGLGKIVLDTYKKNKSRFVYLRRWADDIRGYRAEQLFDPLYKYIQELFGEGYTVGYYHKKYYLIDPDNKKVDCIGYALSLSEASHTKSVAYSNVKIIWFDEFIQMSGEPALRDEQLKYENTLSSIIRDKTDVVIFLLGNTVSKFSPYFVKYGIDINKVKQGTIVTQELPTDDDKIKLRVALEYCEYNEDIGKKTSKYTTSRMISTGQWEIPLTDDIPSVKGEIIKDKMLFTVKVPDLKDDVIIGCFLRSSKWFTIEQEPNTKLYYNKAHRRQFLIFRSVDKISNYYHLSDEKALNYHTYNDIDYLLNDIKEDTDIDIEKEIFMGRVFCDNMFTADHFYHAWTTYGKIGLRNML